MVRARANCTATNQWVGHFAGAEEELSVVGLTWEVSFLAQREQPLTVNSLLVNHSNQPTSREVEVWGELFSAPWKHQYREHALVSSSLYGEAMSLSECQSD